MWFCSHIKGWSKSSKTAKISNCPWFKCNLHPCSSCVLVQWYSAPSAPATLVHVNLNLTVNLNFILGKRNFYALPALARLCAIVSRFRWFECPWNVTQHDSWQLLLAQVAQLCNNPSSDLSINRCTLRVKCVDKMYIMQTFAAMRTQKIEFISLLLNRELKKKKKKNVKYKA